MSNAKSYIRERMALVIRWANDGDATAIRHLAQLDSQPVPAEPMLVGEVDGEILAALSTETGQAIADPFRPTARIVGSLRAQALPATTPGENARGLLSFGRRPAARALWQA